MMVNEVDTKLYLQGPRSDRTAPEPSSRVNCILIQLFAKMNQVVLSDALPPGENLLDYGCADKPYETLFKQKFVNHIGADLPGNKRADIEIKPGGELPSADGSFDCVLSSQVLEHVTDPKLYLREAFRVLRAGGSLIVSTHGIWPYHPDPTDFWRWTVDGLQREIRLAGFEISLVKSVFGLESVALQLWQDATYERLPRLIRSIYTGVIQAVIGFIERRRTEKVSNDAAVYIVLARKVAGPRSDLSR
jgi:SAM-dependent methyltransferase